MDKTVMGRLSNKLLSNKSFNIYIYIWQNSYSSMERGSMLAFLNDNTHFVVTILCWVQPFQQEK